MNAQEIKHFITSEDTVRLLAICNPTWRVIVALARYGGLRCPSEVLSLRWQDVDWETERIVVQSPKTEHHPGKSNRTFPLFTELKPILSEAFELAPEGAEFVVDGEYRKAANTPSGWRNCNLRTQFKRLLKRAGLKPWPRLFQAMPASRETELAKDYPIHGVPGPTAGCHFCSRILRNYRRQRLAPDGIDFEPFRNTANRQARRRGPLLHFVHNQGVHSRDEPNETRAAVRSGRRC